MSAKARVGWALTLVLACAVVTLGAENPGYQGERMLSKLVGEDCILFTTIPSPKSTVEAMKGLAPYRLMNDPETQAFLESGQGWLDEVLAGDFRTTSAEATAAAGRFLEVFDRQISLAVFKFGKNFPEFVLLLESSHAPDAAETWLNELIRDEVFERYVGSAPEAADIAGAKAYSFEFTGGLPLFACAKGNILLLGNSQQRVADTLAAFDRNLARPLAANPAFLNASRAVEGDGADFLLFMNMRRIWEDALEIERHDPDVEKVRKKLDFESVAAAVRFEGDRAMSKIHLTPRAEAEVAETVLKYVAKRPNPLATMELIPDQALFFASAGLNLRSIIDDISDSDDFFREISSLFRAREVAKRTLLKETLKALAGGLAEEVALFVQMPQGGGMIPEGAFVARADDPVGLDEDIEALLKIAGKQPEAVTFLNGRIYMLVDPDESYGSPFAPAVGLMGRNLVLSLSPQTVKKLIRLQENPSGLLRDNPDFKNALAKAPADHVGFLRLDTRALFLFIYNSMSPFLSGIAREAQQEGVPQFNVALLPTADALAQYLSGLTASMHREGNGLSIHLTSEGIDPAALAVHAQVYAPYYLPYVFLKHRRELANRCRWSLHLSAQLEEGSDLPGTQREFVKKFLRDRKSLTCPADAKPEDLGEGYKSSYEYFPERYNVKVHIAKPGSDAEAEAEEMRIARGDALILYDNRPRHQGGRNVLTLAGERKHMSEEDFQEALARQIELARKAGRLNVVMSVGRGSAGAARQAAEARARAELKAAEKAARREAEARAKAEAEAAAEAARRKAEEEAEGR